MQLDSSISVEELAKELGGVDNLVVAAALKECLQNYEVYKKEFAKLSGKVVELESVADNMRNANIDLISTLKEIFIILNADRDTAIKINGVEPLLNVLAGFVMSSTAIKAGVIKK